MGKFTVTFRTDCRQGIESFSTLVEASKFIIVNNFSEWQYVLCEIKHICGDLENPEHFMNRQLLGI